MSGRGAGLAIAAHFLAAALFSCGRVSEGPDDTAAPHAGTAGAPQGAAGQPKAEPEPEPPCGHPGCDLNEQGVPVNPLFELRTPPGQRCPACAVVSSCDNAQCVHEEGAGFRAPKECHPGYELGEIPGACCRGCVRTSEPVEPPICPEEPCEDIPCPLGFEPGHVEGRCCPDCFPDPDYCNQDSDCVVALRVGECCECARAISRRRFEAEPCWSEPDSLAGLAQPCPQMDCTAVDCASCEPPAAARCVSYSCQDDRANAADCADFSCLAGASLVYYQMSEWYEPGGGVSGMGDEIVLDPSNYIKKMGLPALALHFSGDAAQLEMTHMPSGDTTRGTRDLTHTDAAWYTLEAFAGGRFVVTLDAGRLHGEYTLYGSGRPVISSTVGYIE